MAFSSCRGSVIFVAMHELLSARSSNVNLQKMRLSYVVQGLRLYLVEISWRLNLAVGSVIVVAMFEVLLL